MFQVEEVPDRYLVCGSDYCTVREEIMHEMRGQQGLLHVHLSVSQPCLCIFLVVDFFLLARIWGRMFIHSFPTCAFFVVAHTNSTL